MKRMEKNHLLSLDLNERIRPAVGESFGTVVTVSEMTGAWYVEGAVVDTNGNEFGHGWNELDGQIVDAQLPGQGLAYRRVRRCKASSISKYNGCLPRWVLP